MEPGRLEGWQRPLHEDYAASPTYEALVKAGLVLADYRRIDQLVTGLPVSQAREPRRREALTRLLVGRHATDHGEVEVAAVRVVAQPVGAFVDLVWSAPDAALLEHIETGTVLVLDAGYYSVDWAVIVGGELRRGASGTSLEAMSVLIDRVAALLAEQHGGQPEPQRVEAALRAGRDHVLLLGQRVALAPVLERAAPDACGLAFEALRQALKHREVSNVDLVLLAGGGARIYGEPARALFPGAVVHVGARPRDRQRPRLLPPSPVTAGAGGSWCRSAPPPSASCTRSWRCCHPAPVPSGCASWRWSVCPACADRRARPPSPSGAPPPADRLAPRRERLLQALGAD